MPNLRFKSWLITITYLYFSDQTGFVIPALAIIIQTISLSSWSKLQKLMQAKVFIYYVSTCGLENGNFGLLLVLKICLQAFLDFRGLDFGNFWFTSVYNSILFSSPLVLLSNLNLRCFCFCGFSFGPPHSQPKSRNACIL